MIITPILQKGKLSAQKGEVTSCSGARMNSDPDSYLESIALISIV